MNAPDAIERLRQNAEFARNTGNAAQIRADDARAILDHITALTADRDAAVAEVAQIVAWLRGDDAQMIANTHPACMTELADAIAAGAHKK